MLEGKGTPCRCGEQLLRTYFLHGTRTRILLRFVRVRECGPAPTSQERTPNGRPPGRRPDSTSESLRLRSSKLIGLNGSTTGDYFAAMGISLRNGREMVQR